MTRRGVTKSLQRSVFALLAAALLASFSASGATLHDTPATDTSESLTPPLTLKASPSPVTGSAGSIGDIGGGGAVNNEVVIFNITDGRFAHRAGTGIARVTGGDVVNTNSAAATSSCTDCRTVAVAVQAVLVMGDSDYIAPTNQAVAVNNNCLRCHTYALAYQYVVTTGGIVHFTPEGERRLAEIQARISELAGSDLPFLELEARIDALVEEMWGIVDTEVVKAGLRPEGSAAKDSDIADTGGAATPSPLPSSTPTADMPVASPTPTPSPVSSSPSPEPSPTP